MKKSKCMRACLFFSVVNDGVACHRVFSVLTNAWLLINPNQEPDLTPIKDQGIRRGFSERWAVTWHEVWLTQRLLHFPIVIAIENKESNSSYRKTYWRMDRPYQKWEMCHDHGRMIRSGLLGKAKIEIMQIEESIAISEDYQGDVITSHSCSIAVSFSASLFLSLAFPKLFPSLLYSISRSMFSTSRHTVS